jgi:hypothetical protein
MIVTWFAPFFIIAAIYAFGTVQRWMNATVSLSIFQAASPILLTAGGRFSGVQPAYALLPIGVLHFVIRALESRRAPRPFQWSAAHLLLVAMTAIGVGGAFLLPKLFNGTVYVTSAVGHYSRHILHSTGGNAIQAFYLICNLLLFTLIVVFLQRATCSIADCVRALAFGTWVAAALGIYQIYCDRLHLPWPELVINSNLGLYQNFDQAVYGLPRLMGATRRMSATFLEPSMMSMYFLSMFSLFALGLGRWRLGCVILICLLVSTSATALVGLVSIFCLWVIWELPRFGLNMRKITVVFFVLAAVAFGGLVLAMEPSYWGKSNLIMQKLSSTSGQTRIGLDKIALQTFFDTWGLGVGVGSTRSSSFVATFAACTGIPGLLSLFGFFWIVISTSIVSNSRNIRAMGLAFATLVVAWLISIPDLAIPVVWIVSAAACGALSKTAESNVTESEGLASLATVPLA